MTFDLLPNAFIACFALLMSTALVANGQTKLAGLPITTASVLTTYAPLDLDQAALIAAVDDSDFARAIQAYKGELSDLVDTGGQPISLQGLAKEDSSSTEPLFALYKRYYGTANYADDFVLSAMQKTGKFTSLSDDARAEATYHGVQNLHQWMNILHNLAKLDDTCSKNTVDVKAELELAWAKYTGSSQLNDTSPGYMLYKMANSQCRQLGTCLPTQQAIVNARLFTLFQQAIAAASANPRNCNGVIQSRRAIEVQMRIPLIQGLLKYAYRADPASPATSDKGVMQAEAWAFAAGLLPLIDRCNPLVAMAVIENLDVGIVGPLKSKAQMSSGFASFQTSLRSVYPCLGVSCADVGALAESSSGAECIDANSATYLVSNVVSLARIPITNPEVIKRYAKLDVDYALFKRAVDETDPPNYALGLQYYVGAKSDLQHWDGSELSIQSLATQDYTGEALYDLNKQYWKSGTFADTFILGALNGNGKFAGTSDDIRYESAYHGVQVLHFYQSVVHSLNTAEKACKRAAPIDFAGVITSLEEAWAKYAGSIQGESDTTRGSMLYGFANGQCVNFGTCLASGQAHSNARLFAMFKQSLDTVKRSDCTIFLHSKRHMESQLLVPTIQALMRQAYRSDPNVTLPATKEVSTAEAFTFAASILPQLDQCNPAVAQMVVDNLDFERVGPNKPAKQMKSGYPEFIHQLQSTLSCLGLTCADIGMMDVPGVSACSPAASTTDPSSSSGSSSLSGGEIAAIVICTLLATAILMFIAYRKGRSNGIKMSQLQQPLSGTNLAKPTSEKPHVNGHSNDQLNTV